jgi:hypothetical protein
MLGRVVSTRRVLSNMREFPNQLQHDSRWQTGSRLPWERPLRCGRIIRARRFVDWRLAQGWRPGTPVIGNRSADGALREDAAIGGVDRQTLRDWMIRFNDQRPDGLISRSSPGGAWQAE